MIDQLPWDDLFEEGEKYLSEFLQIDTTNPPGNELPAVEYLGKILEEEGIEYKILKSDENRGNLVARIPGKGGKKPLLLGSHVDVVPAQASDWKHPPFSGVRKEDCIWGRGAIDMKSMVIYELMVMLIVVRHEIELDRDLIFAAVADEEVGGEFGMKWLVENHPDLLQAEYSLNEVGGFSIEVGKKRLYPIQVAQKGGLWLKLTLRGEPGHGSMPRRDNVVLRLAKIIERLQSHQKIQAHPVAKEFVANFARTKGGLARFVMPLLTVPVIGNWLLKLLPPEQRRYLSALLKNTITPTMVEAGEKDNVIPTQASVTLDCRTLPGTDHKDFCGQIKQWAGDEVEIEVIHDMKPLEVEFDNDFYRALEEAIRRHDPEAHLTPSLTIGFTDAKHLEPLGMKTYGFYPMKLPPGFKFASLFHGIDERIPVETFEWGLKCFVDVVVELSR